VSSIIVAVIAAVASVSAAVVAGQEELRHKRHFDTWVNVYGSDGAVDRIQILGPRLANLSDRASLTDPNLDAVCKRLGWAPPWKAG